MFLSVRPDMKYYVLAPSLGCSPLNLSQMGCSLLRRFQCTSWEVKPGAVAERWPEWRNAWTAPGLGELTETSDYQLLLCSHYTIAHLCSSTERVSAYKHGWDSRALTLSFFIMRTFLALNKGLHSWLRPSEQPSLDTDGKQTRVMWRVRGSQVNRLSVT